MSRARDPRAQRRAIWWLVGGLLTTAGLAALIYYVR